MDLFDFYNVLPTGCPNPVLVDHVSELLPHVCTFISYWIIVSVTFYFFLLSIGWRHIHARPKTGFFNPVTFNSATVDFITTIEVMCDSILAQFMKSLILLPYNDW
jgi:hypothetical protein